MTAIRIARLDSRYRLPPGPEPPAALRARLDRAGRESLPGALESGAAGLPEASGDEVWLVRHLDVAVDLDLARTSAPGAVARAWSQRLVLALRQALASGDGGRVVRFDSRAAWTARFAAEVAAGTAWDRWYLRAFESLRALPPGRAIAEAVAREPGDVLEILAALSRDGDLELVLLALGPGDARRVTDAAVAPGPVDADAGRSLARALAGLGGGSTPSRGPHLPGCVVRLLAAAAREGIALPPGSGAVAAAVVVLAELAASGADPARLAEAVTGGRWAAALRLAGQRPRDVRGDDLAAVELVAELAGGDAGWVAQLTAELGQPAGAMPPGEGEAAVVATPFGGVLVLWPVFAELWPPELDGGEEAALRRLLVAARLLGRGRREALLRDPLLALLCGLERPPVPARLAEARAGVPVEALEQAAAAAGGPEPDVEFFGEAGDAVEAAADRFAAAVLARFSARLPGFAGSSPGYLLRNFLDVPATLRLGEAAWEATVTSPPLQLVLHMAGMSTLRFALPWSPAPVTVEVRWT